MSYPLAQKLMEWHFDIFGLRGKIYVFTIMKFKMITPIRLYLVDRVTGKKTGKKRDYASIEIFNKYGLETYDRYGKSYEDAYRFSQINIKIPKTDFIIEKV